MYSVTASVALLWRRLFEAVALRAGVPMDVVEHSPPTPITELWSRRDQAAVLMCGLPYSLAAPQPMLVAAPVPSPPSYRNEPRYWSEFLVRSDSSFRCLEDTFGNRIAFTTPHSQSGFAAAIHHLMAAGGGQPLYREIIAPCVTPLGVVSAIIDSRAEVAPVDCFAFDLMKRHAPALAAQVRSVAQTERTPIPPFVASTPPAPLLVQAFLDTGDDAAPRPIMDELLLRRFIQPNPADYDPLRQRLETAIAFWRRHRLATAVHPVFAL